MVAVVRTGGSTKPTIFGLANAIQTSVIVLPIASTVIVKRIGRVRKIVG